MQKEGFTLIELVIVVIIIGILASIAASMMGNMVTKAKNADAVNTLWALDHAMDIYKQVNGGYYWASGWVKLTPNSDATNALGITPSSQNFDFWIYGENDSFAEVLFLACYPGASPNSWHNYMCCYQDAYTTKWTWDGDLLGTPSN